MKIVVMSDSHRDVDAVRRIVEKHMNDADMFVHLGDGEGETDNILLRYPKLDMRRVAGNCDYMSTLPNHLIITAGETRIFCTHGHSFSVKYGPDRLVALAESNNCKVVLYGHTHERFERYEDGIYVMNPGSCSCPRDGKRPSYGIVDISEQGIVTNIVEL